MAELRYGFGKNWGEFIQNNLSDEIVEKSINHMCKFMRIDSLKGKTFLDIGCGSGIHSLAAKRLGAKKIISFDYDENSVATTRKVREWSGKNNNWDVMQGNVLDADFMNTFPKVDIVYSWGVLHHTGSMWDAIRNATIPLKPGGEFYIALYSTETYVDPTPEFWIRLKRAYNQADPLTKKLMEIKYVHWTSIAPAIKDGRSPLDIMDTFGYRGMTLWTDAKDWLGGYPMEFSGFAETRDFVFDELGLDLVNVLTGEGCSEFLFTNVAKNQPWSKREKARRLIPLSAPFTGEGNFAYAASLPHLSDQADSNSDHMRSQVMVYEDGKPLGIAHSVHENIRNLGGGRFSHWGEQLVFSASDNSDPNTNGKTYTYCERY